MNIDDLRQLLTDDPWSETQETGRKALLAALDVVEAPRQPARDWTENE